MAEVVYIPALAALRSPSYLLSAAGALCPYLLLIQLFTQCCSALLASSACILTAGAIHGRELEKFNEEEEDRDGEESVLV